MAGYKVERTANGYYLVVAPGGRICGCHKTAGLASRQLAAIANRMRGYVPRASRR